MSVPGRNVCCNVFFWEGQRRNDFFWLGAAWVKSRAERPSVSEVN